MRQEVEPNEYLASLEPGRRQAVDELEQLVRDHYPAALFQVGPGEDDPAGTYITATVDVDDPDAVVDLVIDRMLQLQIDDGVPVYLIPVRTPERVAALLEFEQAKRTVSAVPPLALP